MEHLLHAPHIGMRKIKSILAIFVGFCLWQILRIFIPGLEVHPIFIYIYGMYMILMISHFESSMYLYSIMRAFQTIIGVTIAWFINVKLLPYPPKPGTLSYWLEQKKSPKLK